MCSVIMKSLHIGKPIYVYILRDILISYTNIFNS